MTILSPDLSDRQTPNTVQASDAVLGFPPLRAPATVRDPAGDCPIQGGPICAGLAARDDFGEGHAGLLRQNGLAVNLDLRLSTPEPLAKASSLAAHELLAIESLRLAGKPGSGRKRG